MKRLLLFCALAAAPALGFSQETVRWGNNAQTQPATSSTADASLFATTPGAAYKTAGLSADTFIIASDSMQIGVPINLWADGAVPFDTGFFYGVNARGLKGAARFVRTKRDLSGNNDTTIQFIGWYSKWGGRIQTTSTKQVTFNLWKRGTDTTALAGRNKYFIIGRPGASATSMTVIDTVLRTTGAARFTFLTTPLNGVNYDSYVGVTFSHTWATTGTDTFGLRATNWNPTTGAGRLTNTYVVRSSTLDTLLTANNYVMDASGAWKSVAFELNFTVADPIIAPLYRLNTGSTSVQTVGMNNLEIAGFYPNPAATATQFKLTLAKSASLIATLYDYSGRVISSEKFDGLAAGAHTLPVNVSNLSAGHYVYMIQSSDGDAIGTVLDVVR